MEPMSNEMKIQQLFEILAAIQSEADLAALLEDLCTRKELENMAERLYAAQLLLEGNTYNQVMARSNISSATLSRVSRCVQYGNGYARLLSNQKD